MPPRCPPYPPPPGQPPPPRLAAGRRATFSVAAGCAFCRLAGAWRRRKAPASLQNPSLPSAKSFVRLSLVPPNGDSLAILIPSRATNSSPWIGRFKTFRVPPQAPLLAEEARARPIRGTAERVRRHAARLARESPGTARLPLARPAHRQCCRRHTTPSSDREPRE